MLSTTNDAGESSEFLEVEQVTAPDIRALVFVRERVPARDQAPAYTIFGCSA